MVGVGDVAPGFSLKNSDDRPVAMADLLKSGPIVLVFYRGAW